MFKVGDKVVYVYSYNMSINSFKLIKNKKYTIFKMDNHSIQIEEKPDLLFDRKIFKYYFEDMLTYRKRKIKKLMNN